MVHLPHHTIILKDGTQVPLLFTTHFFRTYCERKGIEYEDLKNAIASGEAYRLKNFPDMLLVAHEEYCLRKKEACTKTIVDACDWIDDLGGFGSMALVGIYEVFVCKLLNIEPEKFKELLKIAVEKEETKAEGKDSEKNEPALQAEGS